MKKFLLALVMCAGGWIMAFAQQSIEDIYIRDPFILPDASTGQYYMYRRIAGGNDVLGGVEVFKSRDLKNWEGPVEVFKVPADNWITGKIWAPEVHKYKGKYYLFATINSDIVWKKPIGSTQRTFRGTQVFWSKSPEGPFQAFDKVPHTPIEEMALDGTFWVEDGQPYMVYCHEWVETLDGEMKLVKLKKDLSATEGPSVRLFCASAAPWSTGPDTYVTDGCFLYKTCTGKLLMVWSSFMNGEYAIGIAESTTGRVLGPWKQQEKPLFSKDGGHGMIFKTFDGHLCLVIHAPNSHDERAHIFELEDVGDTLVLKGEYFK